MNLTNMFDEDSERGLRKTPPGMAYWAGTGPTGNKCRDCVHFSGKEGKKGTCEKTVNYLQVQKSRVKAQKFPADACKYFHRGDDR